MRWDTIAVFDDIKIRRFSNDNNLPTRTVRVRGVSYRIFRFLNDSSTFESSRFHDSFFPITHQELRIFSCFVSPVSNNCRCITVYNDFKFDNVFISF